MLDLSWWRADLRRPEEPTSADERVFHAVAPVVVLAVAWFGDPGSVWDLLLLLPAAAGFLLRAWRPRLPAELFAALVLVPLLVVVGADADLEPALFLAPSMVLYTAWSLGSAIRAAAILVAAVTTPLVIGVVLVPEADLGWSVWAVASCLTFVLGRTLNRQRQLITELEATRRELAVQAVAEERRRIARELHDLAGHTLAAVLLHVTGARHVLQRDPDEAEHALAEAESVGRRSLGQIRTAVASLRADEQGTDAALAGITEIEPMVEEFRRAGLEVDVQREGSIEGVDGPLATALHRILREALTNVARHAPGNRVAVTLVGDERELRLVVEDRGRPAPPADETGTNYGLLGMAERARALGGVLSAGPTVDGWRVSAAVPRTAEVVR